MQTVDRESSKDYKLLKRLRALRGQGIPAHSVPEALKSTHEELRTVCIAFHISYNKMLQAIASYKHGKTDWGFYGTSRAENIMLEELRVESSKNNSYVLMRFCGEWFFISNCRINENLLSVGASYDVVYLEKSGRRVVSSMEKAGERECLINTTWCQ